MKLNKIISISLILIMSFYILLSCFEGLGNTVLAGQYISIEEAEKICPGISGLVNSLKNSHSGYNFQFYYTGIDWSEALLREYQGHGDPAQNVSPKNLFSPSEKYSGMWYCPICASKHFDNNLSCASREAIAYMMDPRNSITEDSVFQFKSLETADAGYDDIARVVAGTFLNDAECINAIVEASTTFNVNAYYLVAKMLTEHGTGGSTLSAGINVNGIVYYNFFNIGAYGNSTQAIIESGRDYAVNNGWNTKRLSILGGAQIVKDSYIGKGQNTCYYQKFNVVNEQSGLFSHQYAQNVLAAENEGRKFKSYYTINGQVTSSHTFIIPLYANMPQTAQARPSTSTVNSVGYETAVVTANGGLKVRSGQSINSTQIGSIAQNATVKVLIRASAPYDGYYWDLVVSDVTGVYGYVARNYITKTGEGSSSGSATQNEYYEQTTAEGETLKVKGSNFETAANATTQDILNQYPKAVITDKNGNVTNNICTGYTISIDGVSYSLVKKGDVNGDGSSNILDAVVVINHVNEKQLISGDTYIEAARIKGNDDITVMDIVALINYINENVDDIKIK